MSDMHICDRCGQPTPNYQHCIIAPVGGLYGYSICDECRDEMRQETAWQNEPWRTEDAPEGWDGE